MIDTRLKAALLGYLARIEAHLEQITKSTFWTYQSVKPENTMEATTMAATDVHVFDAEGNPQTMAWAVERYGIEIISATIPEGQVGYRVAQLQQKIGPCGMVVRVVDENFDPTTTDPEKNAGTALKGIVVIQGWVDGAELPADAAPRLSVNVWAQPEGKPNKGSGGFTNENGDIGWGWGKGEQVPPGSEGPHWYWVMPGNFKWFSDVIKNLGWVWGSAHDTLNITFQRVAGTEPEPPDPPEPPDDGEGYTYVGNAIYALADEVGRIAEVFEWIRSKLGG